MVRKPVLISACLLGQNCRWDGGNSGIDPLVQIKEGWLPVCPEELGGLGTPRLPAEFGGQVKDVINGKERVIDSSGKEVTQKFISGAQESLCIAIKNNVKTAILKSNSPSCGIKQTYDGTFTGKLVKGEGIFAYLCRRQGYRVISSEDTEQINSILKKMEDQ